MPEVIPSGDLVPMDLFVGRAPIGIDLVYANAAHPENIFGIAVYHPDARLILHKDMARVVLKTARMLHRLHDWTLILKDGLRPIEAQRDLIDTEIVRRNPHWLEEPRLLSGPGQGAHPRGMAIDVSVRKSNGAIVDMGTLFDAMVPESARAYEGFSKEVLQNRFHLETAFKEAAESLSLPMLPLPSEWWDFRFPMDYTAKYDPVSDEDLPAYLKMGDGHRRDMEADRALQRLAKDMMISL